MTQEIFTQFTAIARYIWGGSKIHNIHYEVSENTSYVVYKIITLSPCHGYTNPKEYTRDNKREVHG